MIPRYAHPEMSEVFSPQTRFRLWLEIELLVAEGWAERGVVPASAMARLRGARVDPERVAALEERVGHDVIAFLEAVSETVGDDGRYLHLGLTSSDILDTALAVQLVRALELIEKDLDRLQSVLRRRAMAEKDTLMVGRTHGIHAEPVSFGFVLAGWWDEVSRHRRRLGQVREDVAIGKLAGAVGTHATVDPTIEERALSHLGLRPAAHSTQIVGRDRHATCLAALGVLAGSLEKFATDVRQLQRTEVGEVREPFGAEQKGSSAMPHKRNPILSERICGLARTVRGYALTAMEDQALWHERDISHSSAERIIIPDAFTLVDYMLRLMADIVEGMTVDRQRMRDNLYRSGGIVFSQRVLLALVEKGLPRAQAYRIVQQAALTAQDTGGDFRALLWQSPQVQEHLTAEALEALFDARWYLRHLDTTYARLGLVNHVVEVHR